MIYKSWNQLIINDIIINDTINFIFFLKICA